MQTVSEQLKEMQKVLQPSPLSPTIVCTKYDQELYGFLYLKYVLEFWAFTTFTMLHCPLTFMLLTFDPWHTNNNTVRIFFAKLRYNFWEWKIILYL